MELLIRNTTLYPVENGSFCSGDVLSVGLPKDTLFTRWFRDIKSNQILFSFMIFPRLLSHFKCSFHFSVNASNFFSASRSASFRFRVRTLSLFRPA